MKHARNAFGKFDIYDIGKRALSLVLCIAMLLGMSWYVAEETESAQPQFGNNRGYYMGKLDNGTYPLHGQYVTHNSGDMAYGVDGNGQTTATLYANRGDPYVIYNVEGYGTSYVTVNQSGGFRYLVIPYIASSNLGAHRPRIYLVGNKNSGWSESYAVDGSSYRFHGGDKLDAFNGDGDIHYICADIGFYNGQVTSIRIDFNNGSMAQNGWIKYYGIGYATPDQIQNCAEDILNRWCTHGGLGYRFMYRLNVNVNGGNINGPFVGTNLSDMQKYYSLGNDTDVSENKQMSKNPSKWSSNYIVEKGVVIGGFNIYAHIYIWREGYVFKGWEVDTGTASGTNSDNKPYCYGLSTGKVIDANGKVTSTNNFQNGNNTIINYKDNLSTIYISCGSYTPGRVANINIKAIWEKVTPSHTVTFDSNGGSNMSKTTHVGQEGTAISFPTITAPAGYNYAGWSTSKTGGAVVTSANVPTSDVTYYARWNANTYSITYDTDGGTAIGKTDYNIESTGKLPEAKGKTGHSFAGWKPTSNSGTWDKTKTYAKDTVLTGKYGNVTLKAQWTKNTYAVTYSLNNGSGTFNQQTKTYGQDLTLHTGTPTRSGYQFAGWSGSDGKTYQAGAIYSTNAALTLTAQWAKEYNVTLNYNYTGAPAATTLSPKVAYGFTHHRKVEVPASRAGYTFKGYYTAASGGEQVYDAEGKAVKGAYWNDNWSGGANCTWKYTGDVNVTLYAQWSANSYTVTFKNGDSTHATKTVSYGGKYSLPSDPSKPGYTFEGWYTASSGGTKVTTSTTVSITSDQTLYARWSKDTFVITFNFNGGAGGGSDASIAGKNSWSTPSSGNTFVSYGSGSYNAVSWLYPTRKGYTFTGWYTATTNGEKVYDENGNAVAGTYWTGAGGTWKYDGDTAVTLYAQWSLDTYNLAYNLDGGALPSGKTNPSTYTVNDTITLVNPTKTGYIFAGWTGTGLSVATMTVTLKGNTGHRSYTATWTPISYTVEYYPNGGTGNGIAPYTRTYNDDYTLAAADIFTRAGYTFDHWNPDYTGVGPNKWPASIEVGKNGYGRNFTTVDDETVKLYAIWTANTYTITYDGNGATGGSTAKSTHTYDTAKALTTNAFTRTGYKFLGWSKSKDATTATYTDGKSVKNLADTQGANVTLYAIWELDQVTVTFDANGGTTDGKETVQKSITIGEKYSAHFPTNPVRDGYRFLGWFTAASGGNAIGDNTTVSASSAKTLYAHWVKQYNVTWQDYDGRVILSADYDVNTKPEAPSSPSRAHYDFKGWTSKTGEITGVEDVTGVTVYTAVYEATEYTITLDLNNGTIDGSDTTITYTIEDEVTLPLPTRQFHSFNRWNVKSTTGNWGQGAASDDYKAETVYTGMYGDVTLEARWRDRDIPVNIYTDGDGGVNIYVNGELYKVIDRGEKGLLYTDKFANGDKITLEAVPFVGTEPDEDKFVLSNWHEGDSINGAEVESEGNNYTFTTKTENKETGYSYHAEFTPFRYTIHFDGNGATEGTTADATGKWRRETTLPENGFIRPGYEFKGWCLDKDGSGTIYAPGDYEVDEDGNGKWLNLCDVHGGTVILYAKWTIREYYITFDTNGGDSIDEDNKIEFTIDSDYKLPLPVREGYTFVKWNLIPNTDKNSSGEILSNGIWDVVTDPFYAGYEINGLYGWATLRAEWTPHTYTVEFDLNGCDGTPPEAGTYTTDDTLVLPSHASNGIFAFRGWSTEKNYSTSDVLLPSGNYSAFNIMDGVNIADGGRITLYAVWELTIVYDPDYGSMQPVTKQYYYSADHKATEGQEGGGLRIRMEEISPREGYKPHKWSLSSDDSTGKGTFTAGETYKFTPMMDSDGAGTIYNNIITNKHVLRLYTIWYKEVRVVFDANAGSDAVTNMPTDDIVVSIAGDMFDANVGNPEFELKHIQTITLPNNYPEREGYAFLGWHKNSESSARQVSPRGTYDTLFTMGDYDSENNRFVLYAIWNKSHDVIACYDPADGYETYLNDAWGFFGQHANKWWSQPYFSGFDQNDMFETDSRFYQGGYLSFKLDGSQKYMQAIFGLDSYTVKTTTRVVIAYRVRGLNGEYNMSIGKTFAYQDAYNDEAKAICDGNIHYVVFEVDSKYADQALDRFSLRFTSADDSIIPAGATLDIFSVGYCEGDKSAEFFGKRAVSDAVLALNDYNYTVTYEFADTGDYSGKFYTDEGKTVTDTKTFTFSTGHGETLGWRKAVPLAIETSLYWDNDIPARKGYEFIDWKGSGSEGAYTAGVQTVEGKPLYALSGHLGTEGVYDPTLYLWQHGAMPEGGFTFTIKVNWKALFGSLTLTRPEGLDPGQDFIFTVKGKETDENTKDVNVTVVSHDFADPATDVVVIDALPVGDYTITEWDHWSWRYTKVTVTTDNDSGEVNIQPEGKSVTYNVGAASAKVVQWLSDDCYGRYKDENDYEPEATD